MSISQTAAMAKAYGMSYGEYCMRKEMGTLPSEPKHEIQLPAPEISGSSSGRFRWSKEQTEWLIAMRNEGMKAEEISRRIKIPVKKVRCKLKELKRREQI